jgi:hypothetical protein
MQTLQLTLVPKRVVIDQLQAQVASLSRAVSRAVHAHGKWVEAQTALLYEGPPTPARWKFVVGQIDFAQRQVDEWNQKHVATVRDLQAATLDHVKVFIGGQPAFSKASMDANIAIRSELALDEGDTEMLRAMLVQHSEKAYQKLLDALGSMEASHQPTTAK